MSLARMLAFAGHQIRRCNQIAVALFAEEVGAFEITPVQYAALTTIAETSDLDATRLARTVAFDRSTVGSVLERLQDRGLIDREYRRDDKRTQRLRIPAEGRRLLQTIAPAVARSQQRFIGVLSTAEQRQLEQLLAKLIERHAADEERLES
ncbi:MAG: MarR family transcriptional regulator, temperature-dependent positive regulator of motility [Candidatus Eremiobacteraeota bacterium]|nr:MarR family transcriptional regulator, temperature-dependent positive regulator of motility [Candidatus Eremiobacteraeota bacterium]